MATEVAADALGEEWKGYVVRISGGNDKQGFPMKQGVLTHGRVRLLLSKGHSCYRPRRTGERKRKSVRGCIVDANLSVLNLVIVKKGEKDIPGLTDTTVPRRLGPKRASRIRKLFNLSKEDDVRQYVVRKPLNKEGKNYAFGGFCTVTAPLPSAWSLIYQLSSLFVVRSDKNWKFKITMVFNLELF